MNKILSLILFPFKFSLSLILWILGWRSVYRYEISRFYDSNNVVVVSHTSYIDFLFIMLYKLSFHLPSDLPKLRIIVKPEPFRCFGFLLRRLGCIPAASIKQQNTGRFKEMVEEIRSSLGKNDYGMREHVALLISPTGTIRHASYRTGFYYLAKELNARILVAGMDFNEKRIKVFEVTNKVSQESYEEVKNKTQEKVKKIVGLYPNHEDDYGFKFCIKRVFDRYVFIRLLIISLLLFKLITLVKG